MLDFFKSNFYRDQKRIHLNNAGLSPIGRPASEKIKYWADRFYRDGFFSDADYMEDVKNTRAALSGLIGCLSSEVAFFQSTAQAISQLCLEFPLELGDEVLMWDCEYASNLYPWQEAAKRSGATLKLVTMGDDFKTPEAKLISAITEKTKVIAISWVQFLTGAKTDLRVLSKVTKEKNIFLFVDVMQGLGLHPFHMKEMGVDAVAGGSHKWLTSAVGVGFLALDSIHMNKIRPHNIGAYTFGTCDDPADLLCTPKKDALKFEAGSKQVLEITALGASVDLILKTNVTVIEEEIERLSARLTRALRDLDYQVFTNGGSIVNFVPRGQEIAALNELGCNYAIRGPGIRLSPHAFNTDEEIDRVVFSLAHLS